MGGVSTEVDLAVGNDAVAATLNAWRRGVAWARGTQADVQGRGDGRLLSVAIPAPFGTCEVIGCLCPCLVSHVATRAPEDDALS